MFPDCYKVKLRPASQLLALFTPRNIPLPLWKKVEEELSRMESLGGIFQVSEPARWCGGIVMVPKKFGSVQICVVF